MDELPGDGKCEYEGRLDASKLATPYLCGQVAHTSLDCRRFLISTAFGTAQLCEWHGRCVAGSVVDCAVASPAPPPPFPPNRGPRPPAPLLSDVLAQAGNESTIEAVPQLAGAFGTHIKQTLNQVDAAMHRSAAVVAKRTGLPPSAVYALFASQLVLFVALAVYLLVLRPRWQRLAALREERISEAVEMIEHQRAHRVGPMRAFPARMGRIRDVPRIGYEKVERPTL